MEKEMETEMEAGFRYCLVIYTRSLGPRTILLVVFLASTVG